MGLGIGPNSNIWQTFQVTVPSSVCSALKPNYKISYSLLPTRRESNKGLAHGLAYLPSLSGSCSSRGNSLKRACSASSDEIFDTESSKQIEELARRFSLVDDENEIEKETTCTVSETFGKGRLFEGEDEVNLREFSSLKFDSLEPSLFGIEPEPPHWTERDEIVRINIERRVNRVEIPLSLRIIKRKQQWEEGLKESGDFTCCSLKRAFSSMVFMIRELQSYALHIRESIYYEDLQVIIDKAQRDINASFVWLFQQVFSQTPTLMVDVMVLLANFTAYSMSDNMVITENEKENQVQPQFGAITIRSFSTSSSSVDNNGSGSGGDGGKVSPIASGTGGGDNNLGTSSVSIQYPNVVPNEIFEVSWSTNDLLTSEEVSLWESMVEEASRMRVQMRGVGLDHQTMQQLVSPVTVEIESDDYVDYFRTDLFYQMSLSQDPNNPLLLSNYAQYLFLVAHDNDRAEECFKRAVLVEPADGEALSQYADFLWMARKNMWEAEERYQQAMAAEPDNPTHISKYANFLWNTGAEETCVSLNTSNDDYNKVL